VAWSSIADGKQADAEQAGGDSLGEIKKNAVEAVREEEAAAATSSAV
jgi:hypothetical protein